jgi:hypothetical protein
MTSQREEKRQTERERERQKKTNIPELAERLTYPVES